MSLTYTKKVYIAWNLRSFLNKSQPYSLALELYHFLLCHLHEIFSYGIIREIKESILPVTKISSTKWKGVLLAAIPIFLHSQKISNLKSELKLEPKTFKVIED